MDEQERVVWAGRVETWECDINGHLNARFYVGKCMEAVASLAAELGMPRAFGRHAQSTLVVRDMHIRFMREALPAQELSVSAGVLEIGETDARLLMIMRHLSGEPAAVFQIAVDHVTASEMRPFEWPARVRERAEAWSASVPTPFAPRSLPITPVVSQASRARADELGLRRGALGVLMPAECDIFGRMFPYMPVEWISRGILTATDGWHHSQNAPQEEGGSGGAVLEYRLLFLEWPQAGDRVEQRTAFVGHDERLRRINHWLVSPDTGRAWVSIETILVNFDLETRKIQPISPQAKAAIALLAAPAMTL